MRRFNFTVDVVEALAKRRSDDQALRTISASGECLSFDFAAVAREAARFGAGLAAAGVGPGDVVMTLTGPTPDWVFTMLGTWRIGAVALPCSEQLRRKDIAPRVEQASVKLVVTAERNLAELEAALAGVDPSPPAIALDRDGLPAGEPVAPTITTTDDPALIIFTSGTAGEPRGAVHTQGYLRGQSVQAERWLGARPGDLVWCTAASGWSKSARNAFVAPWTRGAACLLHDARFDPTERLAIASEQGVTILCQSPTEYRMIAKRVSLDDIAMPALRHLVCAGEPLNPEVMSTFRETIGLEIHDGYGQTETGQLTATPADERPRPGSMGKPLPGFKLELLDAEDRPTDEGELCLDPATVPTFFRGYLGERPFTQARWHTGDRVRRDGDGFLWFEGRLDDVIISAGYRIGPFEVESALVAHPAVAEAAAIAAPDAERGAVVRAIVVLRDGFEGSARLAQELQDHVKHTTAPYKYPRIVEFARKLPKTTSGKIKRGQLRRA